MGMMHAEVCRGAKQLHADSDAIQASYSGTSTRAGLCGSLQRILAPCWSLLNTGALAEKCVSVTRCAEHIELFTGTRIT